MKSMERSSHSSSSVFQNRSPMGFQGAGSSDDPIEMSDNVMAQDDVSQHQGPSLSTTVSSLPPADRGSAAWLFLTGCFFIETLLWGESTNPSLTTGRDKIDKPRLSILVRRASRLLYHS